MNIRPISRIHRGVLILTLIALLVTACNGSATPPFQDIPETIAICHATGETASPYTELTLTLDELSEHDDHPDDIIPAPTEGCPSEAVVNGNDGKITICHATGSQSNPYTKITVAFSGLSGHARHENDIILDDETEECPSAASTPSETASPTATATATATVTSYTPPEESPTPQSTPGSGHGETITICHATGSKKHPYVTVNVSVNGLNGHEKHKNDIIPAPAGGCPGS